MIVIIEIVIIEIVIIDIDRIGIMKKLNNFEGH